MEPKHNVEVYDQSWPYYQWGDKTLYMYLKKKKLMFRKSQRNGCLNTVMNGTAFFLPCHSGSIFSDWNQQFGQDKI